MVIIGGQPLKSLLNCYHYPAQAIKNIIEIKSLRTSDYKIAKMQNVDQAKDPCYLIMHIWSFGGQAELWLDTRVNDDSSHSEDNYQSSVNPATLK